ncbi:MAG: two pore domain potassium channel family protein [Planctomycetes bacterium]|nr:two pore domain potassium channel family protein [Planctomycetota bacterium]
MSFAGVSSSSGSWLAQRKFLTLLVALFLFLIVYPALHETIGTRLLFDALLTGLFLTTLLTVCSKHFFRVMAVLLAIPTMVGIWTGYVLPDFPRFPLSIVFHVSATLFFAFTVAAILNAIFKEKIVSADSIYGAFCGYLLIGLLFGHVYSMVEEVTPGSLRGTADFEARVQNEDSRFFQMTYFSLMTLTTVGYGDIIPIKPVARSLAVAEAILGQFYLAVLIAALIGKRVAQALYDARE